MAYLMVAVSVILGAAGQILFKKGMMEVGGFELSRILSIIFSPSIFTGFVFYGTSSIIWLYVLSKFQLSTVYPILSMGYIITAMAGYFLFSEKISFVNAVGILCICIGVVLITRK